MKEHRPCLMQRIHAVRSLSVCLSLSLSCPLSTTTSVPFSLPTYPLCLPLGTIKEKMKAWNSTGIIAVQPSQPNHTPSRSRMTAIQGSRI